MAARHFDLACARIAAAEEGTRNDTLNNVAFGIGQLVGAGVIDEALARERVLEATVEAGWDNPDKSEGTFNSGLEAGKQKPQLILDPEDPISTAREFLDARYWLTGARTLHRHRGTFWTWETSHYRLADEETIRAAIWGFLEVALTQNKEGTLMPFRPNRERVGNVFDALGAVSQLDAFIEPPAWLMMDR